MDESCPGTSKSDIDSTEPILTTCTRRRETNQDDSRLEISETDIGQHMHNNVPAPESHENANESQENAVGPSMNISASGPHSQAAQIIFNNCNMCRQPSGTDSDDEICDNIAVKLKNMYKNVKVERGPWFPDELLPVEDLYSELVITSKKNKRPILLEELFENVEGDEKPTRILIEGRAGIGKTTVAFKLASDWASGKKYIHAKFKLVFLVPLKHFFYDDIDDVLVELGKQSDVCNSTLLAKIKQHPEDVLIILDGYDELRFEKQTCFQPLLNCERYPKMTVVVNCRTNYQLSNHRNSISGLRLQIFPGTIEFWSKKIKISGLKPEKRLDLLKKILTQDEYNNNEEKIRRMLDDLNELLSCPLYLFMLARIIKKSPVHIKTKTQLFISFFGLLISRSLEQPDTVDLLQVLKTNAKAGCSNDGEVNKIVRMLTEFGKLALLKEKGGSTKYSKEEIREIESNYKPDFLTRLGILITMSGSYDVTHYLLVEFLIACHLFTFFGLATSHLREEEPWLQEYVKNDKSMVLPFLAGLLQNKSYMLFESLKPFAFEYSACSSYLASLLVECDVYDMLLISLTPFIPILWAMPCCDNDNGFASTVMHKKVVEHGLAEKKIKVLSWKVNCEVSVCENIVVDQLQLIVSGSVFGSDVNIPVVECTNLKVIVDECDMNEEAWNILIKCICQMKYQSLSVYILDHAEQWLPTFHHHIMDGKLANNSINWIRCCLRAKKLHLMPLIRDLIGCKNIRGIELIFDKPTSSLPESRSLLCFQSTKTCRNNKCDDVDPRLLRKIMESINKSSSIVNVHLRDRVRHSENEEEQKWLDVSLGNIHHKKLNWLRFWTINLDNSQQISVGVRQLDLVDVQWNDDFITRLRLEDLKCLSIDAEFFSDSSLTEHLCKSETLEVLDIVLSQNCDWEPVLCSLKYFQGISTLALTLPLRKMTEHMNERLIASMRETKDEEQTLTLTENTDGIVEKRLDNKSTVQDFAQCLWTLDNLKTLQFFGTNRSPELVQNTVAALRHRANETKTLPFSTLCFQANSYHENNNHENNETNFNSIIAFNKLLEDAKSLLTDCSLKCLQVVFPPASLSNIFSKIPGVVSLENIFPFDKGFKISYDLTGSKKEDPINCKHDFDLFAGYHRYSVEYASL